MPPLRRIDVVLDSVKRLQRIGATANLLNLLQKQHPADLAEVLTGLPDAGRLSTFNTLIAQNSRLAMEALSELDAEIGDALLSERPSDELAKLFLEPAHRRRGGADRPAARRAVGRGPRPDAPEGLRRRAAPAGLRRADRGPHHEPGGLRAVRGPDRGRGHRGAAALARSGDGLLSLRRRRTAPPGRRGVAAPPPARLAGDAAQAHHDVGADQGAGRHRPGGGRPGGGQLQPAGDPGRRRREQAGRHHHRGRRHRRHQGRGHRGHPAPGRRPCRRARLHVAVGGVAQAAAVARGEPVRGHPGRARGARVPGDGRADHRPGGADDRGGQAWAATRRPRR